MKPGRPAATRRGETYFVTSATAERKPFFRYERWCGLFLDTLHGYRGESFALHEFVLMPDHFHLLITPRETLERSVQMVKGGFSRRAAVQFETKEQIWQRGFTDHRVRDGEDYERHRHYIRLNPVKKGLCRQGSEYPYCSAANPGILDPIPQRLKPLFSGIAGGTAEAVPFPKDLEPLHSSIKETDDY